MLIRRADVEEVFPLFHTCFPEVSRQSLTDCQGWMIFYIHDDKAFCCAYPHEKGLILQYAGVLPEYRGKGLLRRMLEQGGHQ